MSNEEIGEVYFKEEHASNSQMKPSTWIFLSFVISIVGFFGISWAVFL